MSFARLIALTALVPGVLVAGLAAPAGAANEPAPLPIGVLDTQRMGSEAAPIKKAWDQVNTLRDRLTGNLDQLKDALFLAKPEFDEFVKLLDARAAGDLTAQQTARLGDLKNISRDGEKNWLTLSQKGDSTTPEEKKTLEELDKTRIAHLDFAKNLKENYETQLSKKAQEILEPVGTLVDTTIATVAKEKGLSIVLSKKVPSAVGQDEEMVLWGGVEITEEVIKRLNKSK